MDEVTQCLRELKSEDRRRLAAAVEHCAVQSSTTHHPKFIDDEFQVLTGGRRPLNIPLVEERGVLPEQLQSLVDFMQSQTHGDEIIGWTDPINGASLKVQTVNLYQLTHWVIKPMTSYACCSFVEAVAIDASLQRPHWFVSHWWGEAIVDFLSCLKHHYCVRGAPNPVAYAYWVCAYANNQHSLGTEVGTDPMQSSFLKAMASCDGVVLVLDPSATPFSRVWCCFELGMVALASRGLVVSTQERAALQELVARDGTEGRRPRLLWDIATVDGDQQPQLLTDGMTSKEKEMEKGHQFHFSMPSGWKAKSKREDAFPLQMIELGLQIQISAAKASIEVDRTRILNSLAAGSLAELDASPQNDHRNIEISDQVLKSTFALAGWRQALLKKIDISDDSSLPLAKALQGDTSRTQLDFSMLKDTLKEQAQVDYLASAIAPLISLVHLHLDFSNCNSLSSTALLSKSLSHLSCLEELFISFTSCGVTSGEIAMNLAQTLKKLNISFQFCANLSDEGVNQLGLGLARLQQLEDLHLCLDCCGATSLDGLESCFRSLSKLRKLKLNISRLKKLHAIDGLGSGLSGLVAVEEFWMQANFNTSICDVCNLGKSLSYMTELRCLDLNFSLLANVKTIDDLGQSLQKLAKLQQLKLSLKEWAALESVRGLSLGLPFLTALTFFSLELNGCKLLAASDVAELVKSSTHLKLERWCLALFGCTQLGKNLVYFWSLEEREKLLALLEAS